MGKAFRFVGEGVFKDTVAGRVVVHMGRRTDAAGNLVEGEIVRDHSLSDEKVAQWVRDGRAEYVGAVENVVDKLTGGRAAAAKPSAESARESAIHQTTADHTDAAMRLQALADMRRLTDDLDTEARELVELEYAEVPTSELTAFLDLQRRERDRRADEARAETDPGRAAAEKRILDLYDDPVFSDKERARAAKGVKKIPADKLAVAESDITAERDHRRAKSELDLGGAGPGGAK
jgi:hypothetical protein